MYTIDDQNNDLYDDEYYENSNWDNRKGLIFKIIIIILCIIVLIWLIKALKSNRTLTDNGDVHAANVEKIRLAAEDYFFIKNNKEKSNYVNLAELKREGLISDVVDANNKVCSNNDTKVNLDKEVGDYKMTIKLSCSTNDKDEVYYYHINTLACLNCKGKTNMSGNTVVINEEEKGDKENVNDNASDNSFKYVFYSCLDWSSWTKDRIYDENLKERAKTLVTGVKYGTKTTYSDWTEYTTTPIVGSDDVEIETKTVQENVWSEAKTSSNIDTTSSNIKVISKDVVYSNNGNSNNSNSNCKNNECSNVKTGNLTLWEYKSGKYNVLNDRCEGLKTLINSDGEYELFYVNCKYTEKDDNKESNSSSNNSKGSSYTVYTYQELETKDVIYYRYRTINKIDEPVEYTTKKYEEDKLPSGFVKLDGSEEIYYSYILAECIK